MLELRDVSRTYQVGDSEVTALQEASLSLHEGDFAAVTGPSGSGKSTLLQIIGLLDRPSQGSVQLDGKDLGALTDDERTHLRLMTIGFVFQRFHLLSGLNALEQVALPMEAAGMPAGDRYSRAADLLTSVGLGARLEFQPSQLSGGQRQRIAVARALANEPRLILADEPTGELHTEDKANIIDLFRRVHREGRTIVVVTHDPEVAAVADRRFEIRDGRLKELTAA